MSSAINPRLGVSQREWGITNSTSTTPIIGTMGVASCFALFIYDTTYKVAALAHVDASVSKASIQDLFSTMLKFSSEKNLKVTLAGGVKGIQGIHAQMQLGYILDSYKECVIDTSKFCTFPYSPALITTEWDALTLEEQKEEKKGFYAFAQIDARNGQITLGENMGPGEFDPSIYDMGKNEAERHQKLHEEINASLWDRPLNKIWDACAPLDIRITALGREIISYYRMQE